MPKINPNKFDKGTYIKFRGEPFRIVEVKFYNPGRGSSYYRAKLKNVKTGNLLLHTFKPTDIVEEIELTTIKAQFLYRQDKDFIFMDQKTFDQMSLASPLIGNFGKFLKEGDVYLILLYNQKPIGINIPKRVQLKVVEAEDAVAGNTAIKANKLVKLETSLTLNVPLFIKKGDVVSVNTETREYLERVNSTERSHLAKIK